VGVSQTEWRWPFRPFRRRGTERRAERLVDELPLEHLSLFFSAYFHEDWSLDHETAEDVLREAIADGGPFGCDLTQVQSELTGLLARDLDDAVLGRITTRLGMNYAPEYDGWTERRWLEHVLSEVTKAQ
jgi:CdiI immunity protein